MTNPRLVVILVLGMAEIIFSVGSASTIICKHSRLDQLAWVEAHLESADVVFLGTVNSAESPFPSAPEVPTTESESQAEKPLGMTALLKELEDEYRKSNRSHFDQAVSFDVAKIWKGSPRTELMAKNLVVPGQYGTLLVQAKSYLVFAYESDDRIFTISTVCGATMLAENAQEQIAILNDLEDGNQSPDNATH